MPNLPQTDLISVTCDAGVALIRLNRPKQLNALNTALAAEMVAVAEALERDRSIGCIVVTGSDRAFAAGADIAEMVDKTAEEMIEAGFFARHGFVPIQGTPVSFRVYEELLRSYDEGVAEFLDLERVKPNTLGNTRMLVHLDDDPVGASG